MAGSGAVAALGQLTGDVAHSRRRFVVVSVVVVGGQRQQTLAQRSVEARTGQSTDQVRSLQHALQQLGIVIGCADLARGKKTGKKKKTK